MLEEESIEYILDEFSLLTDNKAIRTVQEVSEEYRYVGKPFAGLYDYKRTPYMLEIAKELSPQSNTKRVVIMAGARMGKTSGSIENLFLYCTELGVPSNCLYLSATEQLVKDTVQEVFDPMYDDAGVKFSSETTIAEIKNNTKTKKTGDTTFKKSGKGWTHIFKSYGNMRELRALGFKIIALDEVDELVKTENANKQGSIVSIAEARSNQFSGSEKMIICSTPIETNTSVVYREYMKGSRAILECRCPHCGEWQELDFFRGLRYEFKDEDKEKVDEDSVYYECTHNLCNIKNEEKVYFLTEENIRWVHARPEKENRTYYISGLYAPIGMRTWYEFAQKYIDAQGDQEELQVFYNTWLGLPYSMHVTAQQPESLHRLKGLYRRGTIPPPDKFGNEVLICTMGVDVQGGENARLECELLGHGKGGRTWSIDYIIIEGRTDDEKAGAWAILYELLSAENKTLPVKPQMTFIDSSYLTSVVRSFCNGKKNIKPVMGEQHLKNKRNRFKEYKLDTYANHANRPLEYYELDTTSYKILIYMNLLLDKSDAEVPQYYCHFPVDYDTKYFRGLQSETQEAVYDRRSGRQTGYIFKNHGKRNEPLDCRVYALAALEVLAWKYCRLEGHEATDWRYFWKAAEKKSKKNKEK